MAAATSDSFVRSLEQEREAIWRAYDTDEARQLAWSQRKAHLLSYLMNDTSAPRSIQERLVRPSQAASIRLADNGTVIGPPSRRVASRTGATIAMARSTSSNLDFAGQRSTSCAPRTPNARSNTTHRHHRSVDIGLPASYTYGSTGWPPSSSFESQPGLDVQVYSPQTYISQLVTSLDDAPSAAKRQRIDGSLGASHWQPSLLDPFSQSSEVSALSQHSSFMSSQSTQNSLPFSEAMSRDSSLASATSMSMTDTCDMLRDESSFSHCSIDLPFAFDNIALDMPFTSSCTPEKPVGSDLAATGRDDGRDLLSNMGHGFVGTNFSFGGSLPYETLALGQEQMMGADLSYNQSHDMMRTLSDNSTSSASQSESKADERRRRHIENSKKPIAAERASDGLKSRISHKHPSDLVHVASRQIVTNHKEAISRAPYIRPQHPKMTCNLCTDYPNGFRGEHELRRHRDRAHADRRKVWICVEPKITPKEGCMPPKPLGICKQCKQQKQYNVYYNAAAHLRRAHFHPRKRGRKARGEVRESRAGKAGGDWPSIEWLKANGWLEEIEVTSAQFYANSAGESQSLAGDAEMPDAFGDGMDDDFASESYLQLQDPVFAADNLGLQSGVSFTDFTLGYPTPILDVAAVMPWSLEDFQAPLMEHSISAPATMGNLYGKDMMRRTSMGMMDAR